MSDEKEVKTSDDVDFFGDATEQHAQDAKEVQATEADDKTAQEPAGADKATGEDSVDPKSPIGKLLQKEQMKRADLERKIDSIVESNTALKNELLQAIQAQGRSPNKSEKAEIKKLDEEIDKAEDILEGIEDDDILTAGQVRKLFAKIQTPRGIDPKEVDKLVESKLSESRQRAAEAEEAERAWLAKFDDGNENLKGKGRDVLAAYRTRAERLGDLDRLSKAQRELILSEQLELAKSDVLAKAGAETPSGDKKPIPKPPKGLDVIKSGATASRSVAKSAATVADDEIPDFFNEE